MNLSNPPKAWQQIETPSEMEITFSAKKARGFFPAIVFSGAIIICCGYLIKGFLVNWFIDKAAIIKILCLKTPSKTAGMEDTWTTGITVKQDNGKSRDLFFEGTTKEESDFLSGILTQWTGVARKEKNTNDIP